NPKNFLRYRRTDKLTYEPPGKPISRAHPGRQQEFRWERENISHEGTKAQRKAFLAPTLAGNRSSGGN
ncbi:MAG TPA: hypothetical protein PKY55_04750, partial [bacterium]|nr:hypothetical protein [bacterium]